MNILYTCDNNFVWLMGISAISLFENNKHIKEIKVILLGEKISEKNKLHLNDIAQKYNREIEIIDVPKIDIPSSLTTARWPLSAFTRLYAGSLLPSTIKKILYLDCDTVISGDIGEIENIDLGSNVVLGVKDCIGGLYKENIGLNKDDSYFNAGVLLIDLDKLRLIDINRKIEVFMKKYRNVICFADQDILNGILKGRIGVLEPQYNLMTLIATYEFKDVIKLRRPTNYYSKNQFCCALASPKIIHYTTNMLVIRPWYANSDHPLKDEFIKYRNISPWKNFKFKDMFFTSNEAKLFFLISKLPKDISFFILGISHSVIKPFCMRLKSMLCS